MRAQLADARWAGGLPQPLLAQPNVRYLGGVGRAGSVRQIVEGYRGRGIGICQLPCPAQRAWGGLFKRRMLAAYGSAGTQRAGTGAPAGAGPGPFTWYTHRVYARLARAVARAAAYRRCGFEVAGLGGGRGEQLPDQATWKVAPLS